jgi:hypothetical protein
VNTYTLVYKSTARNLAAAVQANLMKSAAPIYMPTLTEAGLDFVSDVASAADPVAIRTIVFQDSVTPGSMPPGAPMAQYLTETMTGAIADGITAPVKASPVVVT